MTPITRRAGPEHLVLIIALCAVAALAVFAGLAAEVLEGDAFALDQVILLAFRDPHNLDLALGPRWLQESARDVTALGGFTVLSLVSVIATLLLALHHRRREALIFAATVIGAQAISAIAKIAIDRPRPILVPHHDLVYATSFPSGHALMTPVVYLTLATIIASSENRPALKAVLPICATVVVLAVGISRVYLGVHWPTDVLAGWSLGLAIALCASIALRRAHATT